MDIFNACDYPLFNKSDMDFKDVGTEAGGFKKIRVNKGKKYPAFHLQGTIEDLPKNVFKVLGVDPVKYDLWLQDGVHGPVISFTEA